MDGIDRAAGRRGEFRTTQNAIGSDGETFESARFVPPPPRFLDGLLRNWERYVNSDSDPLPRLMRFAVAHYQFECIHPFDDGNGRVGRLLIALQLCQRAQLTQPLAYVSGHFERNRARYYELLFGVSTRDDWTSWIEFFLEAVAEQAEDAGRRCISLADLQTQYHDLVRRPRASTLLPSVIDILFESPAINAAFICTRLGVTTPTALSLIRNLEDTEILTEVTGRKSGRVFVAQGILQVVGD